MLSFHCILELMGQISHQTYKVQRAGMLRVRIVKQTSGDLGPQRWREAVPPLTADTSGSRATRDLAAALEAWVPVS